MEGRIIALRVTDKDFGKLEALKKREGVGWNQLLLQPVETLYDVAVDSAHPKGKAAAEEKPPKADKPKKTSKKAKKGKKEDPAGEAGELEGDPPAGDPQTDPVAEELEASEA